MTNSKRSPAKPIRLHEKVEKELRALDVFTLEKILELLALLAKGEQLCLPVSRPMPIVAHGTHELRIRGPEGQIRIFYFVKATEAVLIFHLFKKKTQKTPLHEIQTAKRRLGEMT
jgi:phage-related protein